MRDQIDERHEIVVHEMSQDGDAADRTEALGIRTVPAITVDGALLACCDKQGPECPGARGAGHVKPA